MSLNGHLFHLVHGPYTATIAASGATLVGLRHAGRRLTASFDPRVSIGEGWEGRTLAPWPNRITGARYTFGGVEFDLPANEPATGAALHGLAAHQLWTPLHSTARELTLGLDLPATPGYPFDLSLTVSYALDESGLSVRICATNVGAVAAPVALGSHPYLTWDDAPLDDCTVTSPGVAALLVDERMAPLQLVDVAQTDVDFSTPTPMAGRSVDLAFQAPAGPWSVELRHRDGAVRLQAEAPWLQLYSAERIGRHALAVEAMTHPPDAFNGPDADVALAAGATREVCFTIGAFE